MEGWAPPKFGETPDQAKPGPVRQPLVRGVEKGVPLPPVQQPARELGLVAPPVEVAAVADADSDDLGFDWLLLHDAAALAPGKTAGDVYALVRKQMVRARRIKGRVYVDAVAVLAAFQAA